MRLLSRGITGLAAISPRSSGFVCPQTGAELATDANRSPTFSTRRLIVSLPHHGERRESGRSAWREAAPSTGAPTGYIWAKIGQHWWGTPVDRPTFSPRRLRTSLPHHGERWEPARALRRGAAPSSGGRDAFSASRSEGPGWLAERATHRKGDPSEERPIGRATHREGRPIGRAIHRKTSSDGRAKITNKKVLGSRGRFAQVTPSTH